MNIFPTIEKNFKLTNNQKETLNRLNRRTDKSENLTSKYTDKSFRGIINQNELKIISSTIGKGAFCVMTGKINSESGTVKVEIYKVFKVLLSVFLLFPIAGIIISLLTKVQEFSILMILVMIGQVLIIRYAFIGITFKFLSKESLNRLRDVLDIDWVST